MAYLTVAVFAFILCALLFGFWIFWPAGTGRDIWSMSENERPESAAVRAVIRIIVFGIFIFLSLLLCAAWPVIALFAVIAAVIGKASDNT